MTRDPEACCRHDLTIAAVFQDDYLLWQVAQDATRRHYRLALSGITRWPHYVEYHGGRGHFDWHNDYSHESADSPRKLTVIIQLSDSDDYTGGDFEVFGAVPSVAPRARGTITWTDEGTILTGSRGSVILADGAWRHTSRPNVTARSRVAVLATYIRSFCVTQEDMRFQLRQMRRPSKLVQHLLGGNQYQARTELPY